MKEKRIISLVVLIAALVVANVSWAQVSCEPATALTCGQNLTKQTAGTTNVAADWCEETTLAGNEAFYKISTKIAQKVTVAMTETGDHDILVLPSKNNNCDASATCLATGIDTTNSVTFDTEANVTYYIVIDSTAADTTEFSLNVTCEDITSIFDECTPLEYVTGEAENPQDSCPDGQICKEVAMAVNTQNQSVGSWEYRCVAVEDPVALDGDCDYAYEENSDGTVDAWDNCDEGLFCMAESQTVKTCVKLCGSENESSDPVDAWEPSECGQGEGCTMAVMQDEDRTITYLCSPFDDCDLIC